VVILNEVFTRRIKDTVNSVPLPVVQGSVDLLSEASLTYA